MTTKSLDGNHLLLKGKIAVVGETKRTKFIPQSSITEKSRYVSPVNLWSSWEKMGKSSASSLD